MPLACVGCVSRAMVPCSEPLLCGCLSESACDKAKSRDRPGSQCGEEGPSLLPSCCSGEDEEPLARVGGQGLALLGVW